MIGKNHLTRLIVTFDVSPCPSRRVHLQPLFG